MHTLIEIRPQIRDEMVSGLAGTGRVCDPDPAGCLVLCEQLTHEHFFTYKGGYHD